MADEQGAAPAPTPDAPAPEAAPTAAPSILEGFQDADLRTYAEGKGFDKAGFEGVVKSYQNIEKLAKNHETTVIIPGLETSDEDRSIFYNRLGRPKEDTGYTFKLDDGADNSRLDAMRGEAHKLGITDEQFSGLAQADLAYLSNAQEANVVQAEVTAAEATATLKKEWGAAYDTKVAGIDVAAEKLGFTTEHLEGLRNSMGPVEAMKFVDKLNAQIGDHDFEDGNSVMPNHRTPEQAKVELSELTMSKEFMDAWLDRQHPGHAAAVEKKAALSRLVTGVI
jgi:hypothetical protein